MGLVSEADQPPAMRALLNYLSQIDFDQSPPKIGQDMHRSIRRVLNDPDPYRDIKQQFNQLLLEHYPELKKIVDHAADPFQMALHLAIAGNVIDFGPKEPFDFQRTLERAKSIELAIDDSEALRQAISQTNLLLYLGDNAGEIVMDRIFLETINHANVYFAVRGAPIINDALIEDAELIGIDKVAQLITNGDDAPGTILETTSLEFREIFEQADLIISKRQGNYEGLCATEKNIFFLLMTKCEHMANHLGVKKGDFVVKQVRHL